VLAGHQLEWNSPVPGLARQVGDDRGTDPVTLVLGKELDAAQDMAMARPGSPAVIWRRAVLAVAIVGSWPVGSNP
jgi:hypothetical protein